MLQAILAEPLASFTPPGGRLVRSFQLERSTFYKPSPSMLVRTLAFPNQRHADVGQAAIVKRARGSGWKLERSPDGDVVSGWKQLGDQWARLLLGDRVEEGKVRVSIRIEDCDCVPSP